MKITDISTTLLTVPVKGIRWSGGEATAVPATLIQIQTDGNISGLGDVYCGALAPTVVPALVDHFKSQLLGRDPLRISELYHALYSQSLFWGRSGIAIAVISAIEMALWDIAGKSASLPAYQLLGGLAHDRLPIYASGGLDSSDAAMKEELQRYKKEGFTAVKIRIGHGPEQDLEKVCRAREWLGPDIRLMVDAVQGHNPEPWSASAAKAVAKALEGEKLAWLEEPCAATDIEGYREVRSSTTIPIAGGESATTLHEFRRFICEGALDVVQPDVSHAGGLLECMKIAALAEAYSVQLVPHSWGSGVVLASNYHFGFVTPNCKLLEYPTWGYPLRDELLVNPFRIEDGCIHPPEGAGLGVVLRPEIVEKYPYQPGVRPEIKRNERSPQ